MTQDFWISICYHYPTTRTTHKACIMENSYFASLEVDISSDGRSSETWLRAHKHTHVQSQWTRKRLGTKTTQISPSDWVLTFRLQLDKSFVKKSGTESTSTTTGPRNSRTFQTMDCIIAHENFPSRVRNSSRLKRTLTIKKNKFNKNRHLLNF